MANICEGSTALALPSECVLDLFPPGSYLVSPCLECCDRDPSTCCLHEEKKNTGPTLERALMKPIFSCTKCGTSLDQDAGFTSGTLCNKCYSSQEKDFGA